MRQRRPILPDVNNLTRLRTLIRWVGIVVPLVACGSGIGPSSAASPSGSLPAVAAFPEPPATMPPSWSHLELGPPVTAPFSGPGNQYIMAMTAYGDGFVAVGEDFRSDAMVNGAIWSSPDGASWTRLDTARNDLTESVLDFVATDARQLVAIGHLRTGDNASDGQDRIAWISDDGMRWQRVIPPPFGRDEIDGLTGGPTGFVAWGRGTSGNAVIYESPTGRSWTLATTDQSLTGMAIGTIRPYRGGYVAVGERLAPSSTTVGGPNLSAAAAWWSADGRTWHVAATDEGFGLGSLYVGARGLVGFGGGSCPRCIGPATMWRSGDGLRWHTVGDDVPNWPAYISDGARIIRYDWQATGDLFDSADGDVWRKIGTTGHLSARIVALGPHAIVVGDSVSPGASGNTGDEADAIVRLVAAR
jgi:hypothetical protein